MFLGIANAMAPMEEFNMWMFPPRSDADEVLNYYEAEPNLETVHTQLYLLYYIYIKYYI